MGDFCESKLNFIEYVLPDKLSGKLINWDSFGKVEVKRKDIIIIYQMQA